MNRRKTVVYPDAVWKLVEDYRYAGRHPTMQDALVALAWEALGDGGKAPAAIPLRTSGGSRRGAAAAARPPPTTLARAAWPEAAVPKLRWDGAKFPLPCGRGAG